MFTLFDPKTQRIPIQAWLEDPDLLESQCRKQALNLANLPFAYSHIALMPDTHSGFGMPIGGVLACEDVIVPNAVGVDIGCGVAFAHSSLPARVLKEQVTRKQTLGQLVIEELLAEIPTGFKHHKQKKPCAAMDSAPPLHKSGDLPNVSEGYMQIGTLGGGNHFIELQTDTEGCLGIMIHSGSRNFGYKVAKHFNQIAKKLAPNTAQGKQIAHEYDLAYLPLRCPQATEYLAWHDLALEFAAENREVMLNKTIEVVSKALRRHLNLELSVTLRVNANHNYVTKETHYGKVLWVHRKGAIRAEQGEWGIIPGAMGSYSYITKGLGNPLAFHSCSHGAGRVMSRKEAVRQFSTEQVVQDFAHQGILFGKQKLSDAGEEYRKAYKDIQQVMALQADLAEPVIRLETVAVIKG